MSCTEEESGPKICLLLTANGQEVGRAVPADVINRVEVIRDAWQRSC